MGLIIHRSWYHLITVFSLILTVWKERDALVCSMGRESFVNSEIDWMYIPLFPIEDCPMLALELVAECASPYNSCRNQCGQHSMQEGHGLKTCSCDSYCLLFQDCCSDFHDLCPSMEKEAIQVNTTSPFGVSCIRIYSLIDTCPPGVDLYIDYQNASGEFGIVDLDIEEPVTDANSGLAYKNISYLECNTGTSGLVDKWDPIWKGKRTVYGKADARLCYVDTFIGCGPEIDPNNAKCEFKKLQFGMKFACDLFSTPQIRMALGDFINTTQNSELDIGDTLDQNDTAVMYKSFCHFDYAMKRPEDISKVQLSFLYNIYSTSVISLSNTPDLISFCLRSSAWTECLATCQNGEIRKGEQCVQVKAVEIQFQLPDAVQETCSKLYFINRFIHLTMHNIAYLDVLKITEYSGSIKAQFSIRRSEAHPKNYDLYLEDSLAAIGHLMLNYLGRLETPKVTVCIDVTDACKTFLLSLIHKPFLVSHYHRDSTDETWSVPSDHLSSKQDKDHCCHCDNLIHKARMASKSCFEIDFVQMTLIPGPTFRHLLRSSPLYDKVISQSKQIDWLKDCETQITLLELQGGVCNKTDCLTLKGQHQGSVWPFWGWNGDDIMLSTHATVDGNSNSTSTSTSNSNSARSDNDKYSWLLALRVLVAVSFRMAITKTSWA